MDLHVKLEDERLCTGCPMNANRQKCEAGHVRITGVAYEVKKHEYWTGETVHQLGFQAVRPTSCLIAEERAQGAIVRLPGDHAAVDQEFARAKGVCTKCLNKHKNYEPCRFGARRGR